MATTKAATAGKSLLERAQAKQAVLDKIYEDIGAADSGRHRPITVEERKAQQANTLTALETEALRAHIYSQWVAVDDIVIGNALAFTAGSPVPTTHVEAGLVPRDLVEPAAGVEAVKADTDA